MFEEFHNRFSAPYGLHLSSSMLREMDLGHKVTIEVYNMGLYFLHRLNWYGLLAANEGSWEEYPPTGSINRLQSIS